MVKKNVIFVFFNNYFNTILNKLLLNPEKQLFIQNNLTFTTINIVLKKNPFDDISMQELVNQIIAKQKSEHKLPIWFTTKNIYYPPKISIEQTSSEVTAKYKSNIIFGNTIIDLTGGFGVDCFYFSKVFKQVIHCEINSELSEIVTHNYKQLKADNITTIADDGLKHLEKIEKIDCIYIDPSRRNNTEGKVFLLKDCTPNVPNNIDFLFTKTTTILIKNSPILDISATIKELCFVKEVHIIAVKNEVKELLFLLEKGFDKNIIIKTINITKNENQIFSFKYLSSATSEYSEPLTYLYEPNSAILKSGGFHHISQHYNIYKLHQHSHLYTSDALIEFPGRRFKINNILPYNKKQLLKLLPNKKANITTRNFPKSVAQIRKETKLKDGGDNYLFFTKNIHNKNIVIVTKKVEKCF